MHSSFCVCVCQIVYQFFTLRKSYKQKKKDMFHSMREILHAWRHVSHSCRRFYMLSVRTWEIVSRRETHAQCMIVDSPALLQALLPWMPAPSTLATSLWPFNLPESTCIINILCVALLMMAMGQYGFKWHLGTTYVRCVSRRLHRREPSESLILGSWS